MIVWRKSSHSGTDEGTECVEVAELPSHQIGRVIVMRDSKNPDGPVLTVSRHELRTLLDRVKASALDL
jgi:hypothetical protein